MTLYLRGKNNFNDSIFPMRNHRKPEEVVEYLLSADKRNFQLGILHLTKLSFKTEGEIKTFSDRETKGTFCCRFRLKEMSKEVFQGKNNKRRLGTTKRKEEK